MNNNSPRTPSLDNQDCSFRKESHNAPHHNLIAQQATSKFQKPQLSKRGQEKPFCDNEFHLHQNKNSFSYHLLCIQTCFETEAWGNSEMAQQLNRDRVARVSFSHKIFNAMLAVSFFLLTCRGRSSEIKVTNWMYLFPMNKSASCLPSRTIRIKLTTATAIIASHKIQK